MKRFCQFLKKKFSRLGPGFITGAADDDPSGIATYSIAGAQFGYQLNWLSLFLTPMMISIQEMCGRIGICSGIGLAGVIKKYYSKKLLTLVVSLLLIANTINIGADLGIMAASLKMILGLPFLFWLTVITLLTVLLEIFVPYEKYFHYLKWMGLTLLVYAVTAFLVKQDWLAIFHFTFIPHLEFSLTYLMTMVGFIGTTISPYLFFWQADEEVEEKIKCGRCHDFGEPYRAAKKEILHMQKDTAIGMFFSNLITTFIILTAAGTLHAAGITDIESPQQAALALKPLAGNFTYLLFTVGIIGIGLQSVPILAGGVAYALAETFGFKEGLFRKFHEAKQFYLIIGAVTALGALINLSGVDSIHALYYAAIINGIISVPLIAIIIKLADNPKIVGRLKTEPRLKITSYTTLIFVTLASLLMIINLIKR